MMTGGRHCSLYTLYARASQEAGVTGLSNEVTLQDVSVGFNWTTSSTGRSPWCSVHTGTLWVQRGGSVFVEEIAA